MYIAITLKRLKHKIKYWNEFVQILEQLRRPNFKGKCV